MKNIFISGAHGSACSLVKSLTTGIKIIDQRIGTCHESWTRNQTLNNDFIIFSHCYSYQSIKKNWNPDVIIWIHINEKNITQICRRVVILDFLYAEDPEWLLKDWCWTEDKHNRLQGPSWPPYSKVITDYPQWCLDEMCQVAYDRSKAWTKISKYATYSIDTDELFGSSDPHTLSDTLESLNCSVDKDFLSQWKIKNNKIYEEYKNLFSWTPNWCPPDGWPTVDITENIYE